MTKVSLPVSISVKELGEAINVSPVQIIKVLMRNGVMASINQIIDHDTAAVVLADMGVSVEEEAVPAEEASAPEEAAAEEEDPGLLELRPPVVTVMGHVDHGKTSILDAIRKTNVIATEKGGITQHIGAYQVDVDGRKICFIDTPGHEAFTAMRARGAQVTDIAVLVVAANDGVMPQTVEAIDHARAAEVPIVVAINKVDLESADPERVKRELAEQNVLIEEWGGDTVCVNVSAVTGEGLQELLESILVVAEVSELKANPKRRGRGTVLEAELDSTRGALATVLVQNGTLHLGDMVVAGENYGRVRAMFNEWDERLTEAGPSVPVKVMGLNGVPAVGEVVEAVEDEKTARNLVQERQSLRQAQAQQARAPVTLEDVFDQIRVGTLKELNTILKTDVHGSIEPIRASLERLGSEELKVRIVHAAPGAITENDVLLATASNAVILGFNTRPDQGAARVAAEQKVEIRLYGVIYELVDDVKKALEGLLEPVYVDVVLGHAEVLQTFPIRRRGRAAGCRVTDGTVVRGAQVRVLRKDKVVFDGTLTTLRHFQEDVTEMAAGTECGISLEGFNEYEVGDVLEVYRRERREQVLP